MGNAVWKIALKSADVQDVDLPGGAEILSVAEQNETICMWFRCNPNIEKFPRRIIICGTGHEAPPEKEARFIGTLLLYGGTLVLHVFEQKP